MEIIFEITTIEYLIVKQNGEIEKKAKIGTKKEEKRVEYNPPKDGYIAEFRSSKLVEILDQIIIPFNQDEIRMAKEIKSKNTIKEKIITDIC